METFDLEASGAEASAWSFAFEQLIQKEPAPPMKKSTPPRQTSRSPLTVSRLVQKVECSSISMSDASRIRAALAGCAHNLVLTPGAVEQLIVSAGVDRNELLKVLELPLYPW